MSWLDKDLFNKNYQNTACHSAFSNKMFSVLNIRYLNKTITDQWSKQSSYAIFFHTVTQDIEFDTGHWTVSRNNLNNYYEQVFYDLENVNFIFIKCNDNYKIILGNCPIYSFKLDQIKVYIFHQLSVTKCE